MESLQISGKSRLFCVSLSFVLALVACRVEFSKAPVAPAVEPPAPVIGGGSVGGGGGAGGTALGTGPSVAFTYVEAEQDDKKAEGRPEIVEVVEAQVKIQAEAVRVHQKKVAQLKRDVEEVEYILKTKKATLSKKEYRRWKLGRRNLLLRLEKPAPAPEKRR